MRCLPSLLLSALAGTAAMAAWADDPPPSPTPAQSAHDPSPTPSTAAPQATTDHAATPRKPLDLSAPPVNHVLSSAEVQAMTTERDEEPDMVSVQTDYPQIEVPQGQLRAIPWAVLHPLDAWRIFAPVTE
jgi:hypothetical protein